MIESALTYKMGEILLVSPLRSEEEKAILDTSIIEEFKKFNISSPRPSPVYYALVVSIRPEAEDGGLFATRKIVYHLTKEYHPLIFGITAFPKKEEWIDWAYAVGFDGLLFFTENPESSAQRLFKRALEVFPKGTCGIISEDRKPTSSFSEKLFKKEFKIGRFHFLLTSENGPLVSLLSTLTGEKVSPRSRLAMTFQSAWFKLRRNLRVIKEE